MASECKAFRTEIEETGRGEDASCEARAHAEVCPACRVFFKEHEALRQLVGGLERVEAPADFEFRLRARMAAVEAAGRRPSRAFRFTPGFAAVALASLFVLSVTAALYLRRGSALTQIAVETSSTPAPVSPTTTEKPGEAVPFEVTAATSKEVEAERVGGVRPTPKPQPRRSLPPRFVRVAAERRRAETNGQLDVSLRSAPILKIPNVRLKVSAETLPVVLRDESGSARRLSMKPVSFGSQNPVGRARALSDISLADSGGAW